MATEAGEFLREEARAKVNLFLHVLGRRDDGYHEIESLAVFPEIGDLIEAAPAAELELRVAGPAAAGLPAGPDNLAFAAAAALRARTPGRPGAALRLLKRLPAASGIGGGSADAAATLRLLARLWPGAPAAELEEIAAGLGADAPVCLQSRPALMSGTGARLRPAPAFPTFWMVLANPGRALSTAEIFGGDIRRDSAPPPPPPARFDDFAAFAAWLKPLRNDLEPPALRRLPVIGEILAALNAAPGCALARMSGSGATCFGLFETEPHAAAAASRLRAAGPLWWVAAAAVKGWTP
ncbi:4-(cytidine 5'-diphospho)-2-C-methyl-D-erythritol kinase [Pikeienuella sp. HZG-20]|uniref:4-(cytidine 5'-diphospho)-2-C-methyl-D-erythritol kinase n=1 Tax=Paludibacillus litoralis TaxID=3133267 RepID=UPI0030EE744E